MRGRPRKRSLSIAGHPTSVSLEDDFWEALGEVAAAEGRSIPDIVAAVDTSRGDCGLSTAIRLHILDFYRRRGKAAPKAERTQPGDETV